MSREVRRVPLDFDWPIGQVWKGYITPPDLIPPECKDCEGSGYSPRARVLYAQWYGKAPFTPEVPLTMECEAAISLATYHVENEGWFYGHGPEAVKRETKRLIDLWNAGWSHHLSQQDVDALNEDGRLRDLTHTFVKGTGWVRIEPPVHPTAAMVNERSLYSGLFHDSINAYVCIKARCASEGVSSICENCSGHGDVEAYPGQRAASENYEWIQPPTGEGWQFWETVSEGSPLSPVFATSEDLVDWLVNVGAWNHKYSREAAEAICKTGFSIGSFVVMGGEMVDGVEALTKVEGT